MTLLQIGFQASACQFGFGSERFPTESTYKAKSPKKKECPR